MKKFAIALTAASAIAAAAPAVAQEAPADPFVATQGFETTAMFIVGGAAALTIVSSFNNGDNNSGSDSE